MVSFVSSKSIPLSEEKIPVHYDNASSSSDSEGFINTPSSTSSSASSAYPNMEGTDEPSFSDSMPDKAANSPQVREWIRRWFTQRFIHQRYFNRTIEKLHWTGKDIHNESKENLEGDLTTLGFELYARSLALDIIEARRGDILSEGTSRPMEPKEVLQHVKQFIEKKFEEMNKENVNEHGYDLDILRYFILFSLLILVRISVVWKSLYFTFLLAGCFLFLKQVGKSLKKAAFAIEDKRRIDAYGTSNQQFSHLARSAIKMEEDLDTTTEQSPSVEDKENKREEMSDFFGNELDWKKKFLGIWKIWFLLEIFCYFLDWQFTRTISVFGATCLFCMSNEGIYLMVSHLEARKEMLLENEGKGGGT
ncbi:hypothetical protein HYFRA_00000620 [Hymenoscyphus fraxineus]|uniref:Uncharacterized protein n=1 Tax=Hymenoscyphus fraxineus TaxID=746836 RepID=A0A9N9PWG0_9HELO|nr:hypothetical protein HYFRA_00000620 [Hymenoscyphus fraxineus]